MKIYAYKLKDKPVLSDLGYEIGYIRDLILDEKTGRVLFYLCTPPDVSPAELPEPVKGLPKSKEGLLMVPANSVKSIGTVVVAQDRLLRIFIMKQRKQT